MSGRQAFIQLARSGPTPCACAVALLLLLRLCSFLRVGRGVIRGSDPDLRWTTVGNARRRLWLRVGCFWIGGVTRVRSTRTQRGARGKQSCGKECLHGSSIYGYGFEGSRVATKPIAGKRRKNPDDETLVDRAEGRKMSLTALRQHAAVRGFGSGLSGGRTTFLPQLAYRRSRALACKNRCGVLHSAGRRLTDDSPSRQLRPWDQSRGGSATRRAPWRARR